MLQPPEPPEPPGQGTVHPRQHTPPSAPKRGSQGCGIILDLKSMFGGLTSGQLLSYPMLLCI